MTDQPHADGPGTPDPTPEWRAHREELLGTPGPDAAQRARLLAALRAAAGEVPGDPAREAGDATVVPLAAVPRPARTGATRRWWPAVAAAAAVAALAVPVALSLGTGGDDRAEVADAPSQGGGEARTATSDVPFDGTGRDHSTGGVAEMGPLADPMPGSADTASTLFGAAGDPFLGAFERREDLEDAVAGLPADPPAPDVAPTCPPASADGDAPEGTRPDLRMTADLERRPVLVERFDGPDGPTVVLRTIPQCEPVP